MFNSELSNGKIEELEEKVKKVIEYSVYKNVMWQNKNQAV